MLELFKLKAKKFHSYKLHMILMSISQREENQNPRKQDNRNSPRIDGSLQCPFATT